MFDWKTKCKGQCPYFKWLPDEGVALCTNVNSFEKYELRWRSTDGSPGKGAWIKINSIRRVQLDGDVNQERGKYWTIQAFAGLDKECDFRKIS